MNQFYTPRLFKTCIVVVMYLSFFNKCVLQAQSSFTITKPFIGTSQVCVNSANANYTYLGYAFSSNVINTSGNIPSHSIEISNDLGLITPRIISSVSPNLNVIYVGNLLMSGQNLPNGNGYKIRIITSNPTVYSAFSDPFTILESPNTPTLNQGGTIIICPGGSQTFTITNPNNAYSYQWQNNAANILNETSINYSTNVGGNYSVKVTHPNGCSVSSNTAYTYQSGAISVNMSSNNGYGNPLFLTSNQDFTLNVSLNGGKSPYNFTLTDGITNITETNINSARQYSFVAPVSGSKIYTLSTITDACGSQLNNSSSIKIRINNSKYCSTSRSGSLGIKNFSVQGTSVNNLNSGKAADGWGEYLNPVNINANVNYNFSITPITTTTQQYFSIWTDLNQNGVFETDEKVFPLGNSNNPQSITNTFAGVLKLPSATYNGQTRMRVLLSSNYPYPCDLNSNGETEDYVLNVFNGVLPTVIATDSLPKNGICSGQILPVNFTISGATPPNNTSYKVEVSYNSDFSNPTIIGTGQNSPINCNINTLNFYNSQGFYLRVLPVTTLSNKVINPSPNRLRLKTVPTVNFGSLIGNRSDQATSFINTKSLSIEPSIPISIVAKVSGTPPFSVEMSDGRIFTSNSPSNNIVIEANKLLTNDTKFKLVRISDNLCPVNISDSLNIYVGSPTITINKVQRSYNDTTSITKLCGQFIVAYSATHLDSIFCRTFAVQLSDQNGNFANPTFIGYDCVNNFLSQSGVSRLLSCSIPTNLLNSTGYRLRVVKLSTNLLSPVYATNFEIINSTTNIGFNLNKTEINEGESAALSVNFTGGTNPYTINVNSYNTGSQPFSTASNSSSLIVNLSPLNSEKYTLGYSSACYSYSGSNNQNIYLSVRTLDHNNAQWYIKPFQFRAFSELLRGMYLISGSDTLFKRPYNGSVPNGIVNQYYDYSSPSLAKPAIVLRAGENYDLAQIYSSNYGSANLLTGVWIDKNQDGDFDDVGEELAKNTISQVWNTSQTQSVSIPTNSNIGFSRMRVRVVRTNDSQFFAFFASNPIEKNAETFDIPIVVLSNTVSGIISAPKISGNSLCNGNTFTIDYTQYGIPTGTTASVELSDASGSFGNSPNVIGQGTSSTIDVTLPMNMTAGNYAVRVVSNGITSPPSSPFNVIINQLTSMVDGDWHAGSTWSCGRVPTYVDATTVAGGTTITVFSGDASVGSIFTNGNLSFLNGTTLRFGNF